MGIIDTLTAGFDLVRKRLWIILLPVALNVGLWAAPKLSVFALLQGLWRALLQQATASGAVSSTMLEGVQEVLPELAQLARELDLSSLLLSLTSLGLPILPVAPTTSFFGLTKSVIELAGGLQLVGAILGLALGGLLIGTFYMALIAHAVRDGRVDWPRLVRQVPRYCGRLIGASLVLAATLMSFGLPASMVISAFGLISPGLASLLMAMLSFLTFWIMIYMIFVPEAIIYSEDSILKAIWRSAIIVRTNFWPALGLFVLIYTISAGLSFVWDLLAVNAPGTLAAVAGSSFIGTGLTTALFIFYRERLRAPLPAAEPQR